MRLVEDPETGARWFECGVMEALTLLNIKVPHHVEHYFQASPVLAYSSSAAKPQDGNPSPEQAGG